MTFASRRFKFTNLSLVSIPVLFVLSFVSPNMFAQTLKPNAKIVFFGDSITRQGDMPGGYVQIVRETVVKQMPDKNLEIIGAGIGGNKVPDLLARLDKDVLSHNPNTVVIYIGINDVWHSEKGKGTDKETYEKGLHELIDKIESTNAKVILCTPTVIGEKTDGSNSLDPMLEDYSKISRKVAASKGVQLIDLRSKFIEELKKKNKDNAEKGVLTRDTVHLNKAGNQLVAHLMLQGLMNDEMADNAAGSVRHIVLFKFVDGLEDAKVQEIVDAFAALPKKIDEISDFEMGTNISPENLEQGFTHCFMVTFANEADRDAYLPHPAHKAFVELIGGKIDKVLVFDFKN